MRRRTFATLITLKFIRGYFYSYGGRVFVVSLLVPSGAPVVALQSSTSHYRSSMRKLAIMLFVAPERTTAKMTVVLWAAGGHEN